MTRSLALQATGASSSGILIINLRFWFILIDRSRRFVDLYWTNHPKSNFWLWGSLLFIKNSKELVQDLLKLQGVEYIDWLNKKHQEVITKNTKIIRNCVKNEIKNSNKKDEVIEEINQESNENLESFEDENYNEDEVESERKELIY